VSSAEKLELKIMSDGSVDANMTSTSPVGLLTSILCEKTGW